MFSKFVSDKWKKQKCLKSYGYLACEVGGQYAGGIRYIFDNYFDDLKHQKLFLGYFFQAIQYVMTKKYRVWSAAEMMNLKSICYSFVHKMASVETKIDYASILLYHLKKYKKQVIDSESLLWMYEKWKLVEQIDTLTHIIEEECKKFNMVV